MCSAKQPTPVPPAPAAAPPEPAPMEAAVGKARTDEAGTAKAPDLRVRRGTALSNSATAGGASLRM